MTETTNMIGLDGSVVNKKDENDPYGISSKKAAAPQQSIQPILQSSNTQKNLNEQNNFNSRESFGQVRPAPNSQPQPAQPSRDSLIRPRPRQPVEENPYMQDLDFEQDAAANDSAAQKQFMQVRKPAPSQQDISSRSQVNHRVVQSSTRRLLSAEIEDQPRGLQNHPLKNRNYSASRNQTEEQGLIRRKTVHSRPVFDDNSMDNDSRYSKKTSSDLPTNSSTKMFPQPVPQARNHLRQTIRPAAANGNILSSDDYEEQKDELSRMQELMMAEQNSIFDMHHDFIEAFIGCIKSDSEVYQALRNEGTPV